MNKKSLVLVGALVVCSIAWFSHGSNAATPSKTTTASFPITIDENAVEAKQLDLNHSGPIEHYKWLHQGQTDEVWQNVQTGQWRIVQTFKDGSTQTSILNDGILYVIHSRNGAVEGAEKIPQPSNYTGKESVFKGMQISNVSDSSLHTTATINTVPVDVYQEGKQSDFKKHSKMMYVDQVHHLPLKVIVTDDNGNQQIESWSYSKLQNDNTLFTIPTGIEYK